MSKTSSQWGVLRGMVLRLRTLALAMAAIRNNSRVQLSENEEDKLSKLAPQILTRRNRDENIRDQIVGILDKDVSRKLQLMKDLTVALTIETVWQFEEVASQGCDVSIIRKETYHSLIPKRPLEPADIPLDSPRQ
ncbi:hypothetical protein N1851_030617 [Merluccius polli]|uniref:Uncharacterized protein n=1 Tax=Merluccius polli TaxID=89951 RepID=A0AA47M5B5_MERPO|nr:hypothetical protein N1851_030617 [Merluccius polli]